MTNGHKSLISRLNSTDNSLITNTMLRLVKKSRALNETPPHNLLRDDTCHMGSHSITCNPSEHSLSVSSAACRRRRGCHEFPPCRSVLSMLLRRRQSEVHCSQVSLHRSQPGLSGTTNPPSPIIRRTQNASL